MHPFFNPFNLTHTQMLAWIGFCVAASVGGWLTGKLLRRP